MAEEQVANPARWAPDPFGRHEYRYWDGRSWTDHVSDRGVQGHDPAGADAPPQVPPVGPAGGPMAMTAVVHVGTGCASCGRDPGPGRACQFCGQVVGEPNGVRLSSIGKRLGAHVLEVVLFLATLGIGWIVWSLVVWGSGQTPAKQLLAMKVVKLETGRPATWGTMFLREFVGKFLIFGVIWIIPLAGLVLSFMLCWDRDRQELWDKIAATIVVDDPDRRLA